MPRTEAIAPIHNPQRDASDRSGQVSCSDVGWHGHRAMTGTQIPAPVANDVWRLWLKEQHG
jgi:hypothetical protein